MAMLISDDEDTPFKQENSFESILNLFQPPITEHEYQQHTLPSYSLLRSSLPSPIEPLNNQYTEAINPKEEENEEVSTYSEKGSKKRSRKSIGENNNEYDTNGNVVSITMEYPSNKTQKISHEIHYEIFNDKMEETPLLDVEDDDIMGIGSLPPLPPLQAISSGMSSDQVMDLTDSIDEISPINVENAIITTNGQDYCSPEHGSIINSSIAEPSVSSMHSIVRDINIPSTHPQSATLHEMNQEFNTDAYKSEATSPCAITSISQIARQVPSAQGKNNDQLTSNINKDDLKRGNNRLVWLQTRFILFLIALMIIVIAITIARMLT